MSKSGKKSAPIVQHTGFGGASQLEENPVPVSEPDFIDFDDTSLTESDTYTDSDVPYGDMGTDESGFPLLPKGAKRRRKSRPAEGIIIDGKFFTQLEFREYLKTLALQKDCKTKADFLHIVKEFEAKHDKHRGLWFSLLINILSKEYPD